LHVSHLVQGGFLCMNALQIAKRWPAGKRQYAARNTPLPTGLPHGPRWMGSRAPQAFAIELLLGCSINLSLVLLCR
jgi:hypothetical protein